MTAPTPADDASASGSVQLSALISAHQEVVAAIDADPDRQRACLDATRLTTLLRSQYEDASHQRAIIATQIVENTDMKLSGLAKLLGVSKQRANQIVKIGKGLLHL